MSSNKIYGIRQILETIYHKNLKEISLDKLVDVYMVLFVFLVL